MMFCLAGVAYILTEEAGVTDCVVIEVYRSYVVFSWMHVETLRVLCFVHD